MIMSLTNVQHKCICCMKMVQVCSSIRQEDVMCPKCVQRDIDRALLEIKMKHNDSNVYRKQMETKLNEVIATTTMDK